MDSGAKLTDSRETNQLLKYFKRYFCARMNHVEITIFYDPWENSFSLLVLVLFGMKIDILERQKSHKVAELIRKQEQMVSLMSFLKYTPCPQWTQCSS